MGILTFQMGAKGRQRRSICLALKRMKREYVSLVVSFGQLILGLAWMLCEQPYAKIEPSVSHMIAMAI